MEELDSLDLAILHELQTDCARSVQEIGEQVGLSQSPCWRRIRRLEQLGVLGRRVALVSPEKVGLGVTVFVTVRTNQHNEQWLDAFARAVANLPEIVECYRMSGDVDYLLKILAADISGRQATASDFREYAETCTAWATSSHGPSRNLPPSSVSGLP